MRNQQRPTTAIKPEPPPRRLARAAMPTRFGNRAFAMLAWVSLVASLFVAQLLNTTFDTLAPALCLPAIIAIVFTAGLRPGVVAALLAAAGVLLIAISHPLEGHLTASDADAGEFANVVGFFIVAVLTGWLADRQREEARAAAIAIAASVAERRTSAERQRRLAYLANLGEAMAAPVDDADLLDRVVACMVPELGDLGIIALRDESTAARLQRLEVAPPLERETFVALLTANPSTPDDAGGLPFVLRTGQAIFAPESAPYLASLPADDRWRRRLTITRATSVLCEPLIVRGEVIGGLTLTTHEGTGRTLSEDDAWLAHETARRTAIALDNAMLYRRARVELAERTRAESDLRLLADLTEAMKADLSIPELVAMVTTRVADYLDLHRIVFAHVDPDGLGAFDCHFPPGADPTFAHVPLATLLPADDPRLAALQHGEPLVGPDRLDFPVLRDGALVAIGSAEPVTVREWRPTDVALFGSLADRAWLGIENFLFFTRSREAAAEREAALAAATASEERFRRLFESTADAVIVIGAGALQILDANPAALALFGVTREQLLSDEPPIAEIEVGATERAIAAARAHGEWRGEARYRLPDGATITVEGLLRPLDTPEQELIVAAVRDVSDRATFEAIRQDLFATIAHDLKNPLASIKATAQGLRRQAARGIADPARLEDGLRRVDNVVERMVRQIEDLEDAARIDSGRLLDLDLAPVDLVELAREVVGDYQGMTERHRLTLANEAGPLIGRWDARRIRRVIENLVSNAIKYSPQGGEVALITRRVVGADGTARAELEVLDDGVGIANVELPHVFDRFWRSRGAGMRVAGAGIGLVGARQIVEQHGGAIGVARRDVGGSSFSIRLPLPPAAP
jgi:PAS domain S-box-containing protein